MKKILVLGATSAIAEEYIKLNADGNHLLLVARDSERLEAIEKDSKSRGAIQIECMNLELKDPNNIIKFFRENTLRLCEIDIALIASGTLPSQTKLEQDTSALSSELNINAISPICFINELLSRNALKETASIATISSVAGDRGRQSNYIYGSAKSCLSTYLEGLWHKSAALPIKILDVKPGFVDTPMTKSFDKGILWSKPQKIASLIDRAIKRNKQGVIYTPYFWRLIMFIIRHIPHFIFQKIRL